MDETAGKKKYVIFLVLGKLLKRWIQWWSACGSVSPSPLIKDGFFALHHLFIKRKVGIFAFRHILTEL
jgi:quinol-cytochrome oxidoreductase complex cytochrome b subunit